MNVLTVFFCFTSSSSGFTTSSFGFTTSSFGFTPRMGAKRSRKTSRELVIDRDVFQNSNQENMPNPKKWSAYSANKYYERTLFKRAPSRASDGFDHRFLNATTEFSDSAPAKFVEHQRKLNLLTTLENDQVSEIAKLQLIRSIPEVFCVVDSRDSLYRGFEEFL